MRTGLKWISTASVVSVLTMACAAPSGSRAADSASATTGVAASSTPTESGPSQDPDAGYEGDGTGQSSDSSHISAAGPGTYSFKFNGVFGQVEVPVVGTDTRLRKIEAYRKLASAEPVSYVVARVDNQSLDQDVNMYGVTVVTDDGEQVEAKGVDEYIDKWMDAFGADDTEKYNQGVDLVNANMFHLLPGAKGTDILVSEKPIKSVKRVFIYPSGGMDRVEGQKVG